MEQALWLNPAETRAHITKGSILRSLERYEESLAAFDAALRLDVNNADAYSGKGGTLRELKRYKEALVAFNQAIELDENELTFLVNKARVLSDLHSYKEACDTYKTAQKLNPHSLQIRRELEATRKHLTKSNAKSKDAKQATTPDPSFINAHLKSGKELFALNRFREAEKAFLQTIKLAPTLVEAHYYLGNTLFQLRRFKEALKSYTIDITLRPTYINAHYNKGVTFVRTRQYEEALTAFNETIQLDPAYIAAYTGKCDLLIQLGRYREARAAHDGAKRLLNREKNIGEQSSVIQNAIKRQEKKLNGNGNGRVKVRNYLPPLPVVPQPPKRSRPQRTSQSPKQSRPMKPITIVDPYSIEDLCLRGEALLNLHRYEEALKTLQEEIQLNPKNADAHLYASFAWNHLGEEEMALGELMKANKLRL